MTLSLPPPVSPSPCHSTPSPHRSLYQAVTVVLRDVKQSQISEEELKLLLGYVEEDIHDYQRQMTAFPLLRVPINICET